MNRAEILAEIGIDTWVRNSKQVADTVDSDGGALSPDTIPLESMPSDTIRHGEIDSDISGQGPPTDAANAQRLESEPGAPSGATAIDSIEGLRSEVIACQRCQLSETRNHAVPGVGSSSAKWLFIGKAPGVEEDRQGEPFVGRAGQLLDNMLRAIDVAREDVYISSVLKCHPPGNRDLKSKEIDSCRSFLSRELLLVQPDVVVALGDIATRELLKSDMPINKLRGKTHRLAGVEIPCVVTFHPAAVLRDPTRKKHVWDDLLLAKSLLLKDAESSV